ncbi:MAG TPA: hypothetical protein VEQ60_25625 [Longimicrobium sp.]|nr:hypothetical protein [Longimicrobium sp.]
MDALADVAATATAQRRDGATVGAGEPRDGAGDERAAVVATPRRNGYGSPAASPRESRAAWSERMDRELLAPSRSRPPAGWPRPG